MGNRWPSREGLLFDESYAIDPSLMETEEPPVVVEDEFNEGLLPDGEARKRETNRVSSLRFRTRKNEQASALDITIQSLKDENERLKKVINMMEGGNLDRTLGELATAAVEATGLSGFAFENLQLHLENQSAFDFTQGLVSNITLTRPSPGSSDPFEITRLALLKDLAETRARIAEKDAELKGLKRVRVEIPDKVEDTSSIQTRLTVLRDLADRLEISVAGQKASLEVTNDLDVRSMLLDIRGYIEGMLRTWKEASSSPSVFRI